MTKKKEKKTNVGNIFPEPSMKAQWGVEVQFDFWKTMTLDGSEYSASCPGHFTNREETPLVPTEQDAGWTPELMLWQREKSLASAMNENKITQLCSM